MGNYVIGDIHNSWLYCIINPQRIGYIFNYKKFHKEASVETIKMSNYILPEDLLELRSSPD